MEKTLLFLTLFAFLGCHEGSYENPRIDLPYQRVKSLDSLVNSAIKSGDTKDREQWQR